MSNFFKSPFYFLFCASLGFSAWVFSFESELNQKDYFSKQTTGEVNMSSQSVPQVDDDGRLIQFDEYGHAIPNETVQAELNAISDEELLKELELSPEEWEQKTDTPYSTSPAEVEQYENMLSASYGELNMNDFYLPIAAEAPKIQYEDEKKCTAAKLAVEAVITKSPSVSELIKEKTSDDSYIPRKCLVHVMNQFNLSSYNMGKCPKGLNSMPQRGGSKPCVSKSLANLTYNSYVDVTSCLGVNPKSLIPKLSNESGMLINTYGSGMDAGVGQLTGIAIEETNKYYDGYMKEIEESAKTNQACARLLKYKPLLAKVSHLPEKRCGLIAPPENPLKNILYMAMLNRMNTSLTRKKFENNDIESKLVKLGLSKSSVSPLIEAIALASYNAGPATAFNALNEYLDKRIKFGKKLTPADFDFHSPKTEKDLDGKEKSVVKIARSYVNSPFIKKGGDPDLKMKLLKAKALPGKIRSAHLLTFPEFMIYSQNNFDETQKIVSKNYHTIGAPGYLSFLAEKDQALRDTFAETSGGANFCSNPNFLKIK